MKITFIGHAALLAEARGVRVLSDPWWRGPCFGAQWWNWPRPDLSALAGGPVDYVYISHGHHDHLHPGTLSMLEGRPTILVARSLGLASSLRSLANFPVREVDEDEVVSLDGGLKAGIWPTHGGDSLMWLSDGEQVLVNANDSLHSAPAEVQARYVERLRERLGKIDYFFCGFATASHFPNCCELPGVDRVATARQRQHHFNEQWLSVVKALAPGHAFPFAGDVAFFEEDLFWLNAALHNDTHMDRRIAEEFPAASGGTIARRIGPGFAVQDRQIVVDRPRPVFDPESVREEFADELRRANRYGALRSEDIDEVAGLLEAKLERFPRYFGSCPFDYRYAIGFREGKGAIEVTKVGDRIEVGIRNQPRHDGLEIITRLAYLRYALETPFGYEILFVGSGIRFRYPDTRTMRMGVHREAMALLRPVESDSARRFPGSFGRLRSALKRAVDHATGRARSRDLYDLEEWLVMAA